MVYSGLVRAAWQRVLYGAADDTGVLVKVETPVQIQEQLEDAVTYVAQFGVAGKQSGILSQGEDVYITNVSFIVSEEDDPYDSRRMFTGVVDHPSAASFENSVTITCTGNLGKLRKKRGTDYALTGKTDQQAAKDILTYCGISYTSGDILGDGYVLGAIEPIIWKKGQSGDEMLGELDRVFGYATIEMGSGRVVRFPYSKVPSEYSDTIYGSSGTAKNYRRGTAGLTFYENERERGSIDEIRNSWRVNGLSYQGDEGAADEGCDYQIYAESYYEHPLLGTDVYQSEEFSSDLIQSEELAKKIAARLMRWYNRTPDTIRVVGGNDPPIGVGDLIGVRDPAFGIGLDTTQRYLIMNISRNGDFMTLDCVGGDPGEEGTIVSGISKCCGTQLEDGTCDETGTDPGTPGPNTPDIPPDVPIEPCDPITNPNCIPGGDDDEVVDPDYIHPVIGCTLQGSIITCDAESDEYDECIAELSDQACTGTPPGAVCLTSPSTGGEWFRQEETEVGPGYSCDCQVQVPWRDAGTGNYYRVVGQQVTAVGAVDTNSTFYANTETDPDLQTPSTDVIYGSPLIMSISGKVTFNDAGSFMIVQWPNVDGGGAESPGAAAVTVYADPGLAITPVGGTEHIVGVRLSTEKTSPVWIGNAEPHTSISALSRNNGGYVEEAVPPAIGERVSFTISIDMSAWSDYGITYYQGSNGGGHIQELLYLVDGTVFPGEPSVSTPDAHVGHKLKITLAPAGTGGTTDVPGVILEDLIVGIEGCESNDDYNAPIADDQT